MEKPIHQTSRVNRTEGDERAHCHYQRQSNPIHERLGHEPNSFLEYLNATIKIGTAGTSGETALIVVKPIDTRKEFMPTGQKQSLRQNGTSEELPSESVIQTLNPLDSSNSQLETPKLTIFRY